MPIPRHFAHGGKTALATTLCAALLVPPALVAEPAAATTPSVPTGKSMDQQQRVLHALNRFTFGPRPGDQASVQALGLDAWFERQLNPQSIPDTALDAHLAAFPALRLSQQQLLARFPSPQTLRQIANGNGPWLPHDPVEHAIFADASASYALKLKAVQQNQQAAAAMGMKPEADADGMADDVTQAIPAMQAPGMNSMDASQANGAPAKKGKAAVRQAVGAMPREQVDTVLELAPDARFQRLVAMAPEEMIAFRNGVRGENQLRLFQGLTPEQVEAVGAMQAPARVVAAEALESRLVRDVYSDRQLEAVMTDFWLNHFSVYAKKNQNEPYYLASYERDAILPHALGRFEDLLVATAKSPAMLVYLDNAQSVGPDSRAAQRVGQGQRVRPNGQIAQPLPKGINENYARELMELHTLGVGGGYTQADIIEVARCFTGWTIDRPAQGGGFEFNPNRHEPGPKQVLGHTIAESGMNEGLAVLHILATSPATARFISHKLAVRFVSDNPPPAVEQAMTAAFLKSGGDIREVLRAMFRSPQFWSADVYRAKVKTPIEFVASALRASDASVDNAVPLVQAMERLGMPIYGMPTPNGYSWTSESWVSSNALLTRMNFALVLSGDRLPGTRTDWPALLGSGAEATTPTPQTEARLERLLLGQPAAERTRSTVLEQFSDPNAQRQAEQSFNTRPADGDPEDMASMAANRPMKARAVRSGFDMNADQPETPLDTMAGLLLGSPDFQRR